MKCANCSNELISKIHLGYSLFECPVCQSILVSTDQVGPYLNAYARQAHIPQQKIEFDKKALTTYKHKEEPKPCPNCHHPTVLFNYRYDSNIFLNKCQNCNLVFIEGHEIKPLAIIVKGNKNIRELGKVLLDIENEKIDRSAQNNSMRGPFVLSYTPIVISDAQPKAKIPYVTIAIITLCTGIFIAQSALITDYDSYFAQYGFTPADLVLKTLITSIFLHGSIAHLVGNMYFLWVFGDNVEDKVGHFTYFGWYLLFGIFASLLALIFPTNMDIPHIGASGAISGILGAYYIFYPHSKLKVFWINGIQKLSASSYIIIWFIIQIVNSLVNQNSGVSWTTHIIGCALGAATAYSYKKLSHLG